MFASSGCGGCHTLKAAGAEGQIGPNLDNLAADARKAGQPLAEYVKQSIIDPNAYTAPGYIKGVMPTTFSQSLTSAQLGALIAYLVAVSGK